MSDRRLNIGAVELAYRDEGPRDAEPLLLLMGLGMQLTAWPQAFVDGLVTAGFRVIRLDHRDIGLSTPFDHLPAPSMAHALLRHAVGLPMAPPYQLADLADDAAALLGALGIAQAQVLGVSMGGMVAQHLALRHAQRVSRLHLWMTSPGGRWLPPPRPQLLRLMVQRPRTREQALEHYVRLFRALAGPGFESPETELRHRVAEGSARSWRPQATLRQVLSLAADGDRRPRLRSITPRLPIHILHGGADPLLPPAHARALAVALPQASLRFIDGWGHDLPTALLPRLVEEARRHG